MKPGEHTNAAERATARERWSVVDYLARGGVIEQPNAVRSICEWLGEQSAQSIIDHRPAGARTVFEWLIKHSKVERGGEA